jgi:hypothetical protein
MFSARDANCQHSTHDFSATVTSDLTLRCYKGTSAREAVCDRKSSRMSSTRTHTPWVLPGHHVRRPKWSVQIIKLVRRVMGLR